jgi:hypothetical protein
MIELKTTLEKKYWDILNNAYDILEDPLQESLGAISTTIGCKRNELAELAQDKLITNLGSCSKPVWKWNIDIRPNIHTLQLLISNVKKRQRETSARYHAMKKIDKPSTELDWTDVPTINSTPNTIRDSKYFNIIDITETSEFITIVIDKKYKHLALELLKVKLSQ